MKKKVTLRSARILANKIQKMLIDKEIELNIELKKDLNYIENREYLEDNKSFKYLKVI